MGNIYVKKDGASLRVEHILSFDEKEFVAHYDDKLYLQSDARTRKAALKELYKMAKKENEKPEEKQ